MLILSTHVDDLKGGGVDAEVDKLIVHLEKLFDKGKLERQTFEHCGVKHHQKEDLSIETHMNHYVDQLRPIVSTELATATDDTALASAALIVLYASLLGALAWLTQGRPDISVYVVALQRHNKNPTIAHCKKCNRLLSYVRRKRLTYNFIQLTGNPWRIVCASDSAYKVEENDARALVGHMILFMAGNLLYKWSYLSVCLLVCSYCCY